MLRSPDKVPHSISNFGLIPSGDLITEIDFFTVEEVRPLCICRFRFRNFELPGRPRRLILGIDRLPRTDSKPCIIRGLAIKFRSPQALPILWNFCMRDQAYASRKLATLHTWNFKSSPDECHTESGSWHCLSR